MTAPSRTATAHLVRALRLLAWSSAAALLIAAGVAFWAWTEWNRVEPGAGAPAGPVEIRVPPGSSLATVADTLQARGLLDHRQAFVLGARLTGSDRSIRAGRYAVPRGLSPRELLILLVGGRTLPVVVMVPEGLPTRDAVVAVAEAFGWAPATFRAACDAEVRALLLETAGDPAAYAAALLQESLARGREFPLCEGYLFPETYHFAEGASVRDVARAIMRAGWDRWVPDARARLALGDLPLRTPHEVLTLASIVEAETPRVSEMPRVAAVYLNRLRAGRPLQADPTVAHALGKKGQRILYSDLRIPSVFNTYLNRGLPPGPIGNPGLAAIAAVLKPLPGCQDYFFVADGYGGHVFSRTHAQHEAAVQVYRQRRAEAQRKPAPEPAAAAADSTPAS
ncbi:MAG: endolytic transglycosylase MltG [bacterium]|nr:endolytic transglycosylase MltG [bacterium]